MSMTIFTYLFVMILKKKIEYQKVLAIWYCLMKERIELFL